MISHITSNHGKNKFNQKEARIAGFWYLLSGISAGYSWIYTTKIFVAGNAALTSNNTHTSTTSPRAFPPITTRVA